LAIYLNKKGYAVATAGNSTEALKRAGQSHIDLIVLDISLAGEDGLSVLAAIKARHPATKVVMLTGMGFVEDLLQEAQEKGADGYVSKVLPLDELLLAIHRTLRPSDLAEAA
jgi:DNA-binding response OmpR family regulator